MGCSTSRIDHLPVVSLCHDRCKYLEEALYQSYALADSHVAYMHCLKALGPTLRRFFDQINVDNTINHSISKANDEPVAAKLNPPTSLPSPDNYPSSSNSDSPLDFPSDSEDEQFRDGEVDLLHRIHPNYFDRQTPTPSRSDSYTYRDHNNNKCDYYAHNGGFFCSYGGAVSPDDSGFAWKTPLPPPPPSGSTWEFLNLFDAYERFELPPTKDKEGIRDLKDELEKESCGDSVTLAGDEKQSKAKLRVESGDVNQLNEVEVDTNVVCEKEKNNENKDSADTKNPSIPVVMREVQALFERAAESGNEVLKILDTGKFRYCPKNSIYQGVSSKVLHVVTPSFLVRNTEFSSATEKISSVPLSFDEDLAVISVNLSSTVKKLCMWEKKLYDEVKAEEKLRTVLVKNYRHMKNMGEKRADANKVDSARTLVRALSTKIKVSIQVIDRTAIAINKLRDEELWPLINELIQKLLGMWKAMLECHTSQTKAVVEARCLDTIVSNGKFSETHLEAAIQLKIELQNWSLSFSNWIGAQRGYIKALNSWLLKFLPYEPQEMSDESPPLSPRRAGVPPLFTFCNQWSHAMGIVSEIEVINAMHGFFMNVDQLVERHSMYLQQRMITDKDLEKRMKNLEREEKRMQKILQIQGKKNIFLLGREASSDTNFSGGAVRQSEMTNNSNLELGLKQIFITIEKFSAKTVQLYEELQVRVEEGVPAQEHPIGP